MRIGIITYWQSNDNYGQLLQCWALQQYLKRQGHEPFLIRYDMLNRVLPHQKRKKVLKVMLVYPVIRYLLNRKKKRIQAQLWAEISKKNILRKFDEFRDNMVEQSPLLYSSLSELQSNPPQADVYITGSDQVWSQLLDIKENEVFFLNFGTAQTKRISYAASFGMEEYPKHLREVLSRNLQRFDKISVREKTGMKICADIGVSTQLVVDPTLLLPAADYRELSLKSKYSDYVYIYSLNISSSDEIYFEKIKEMATAQDCKIVVTPATGCTIGAELFDEVTYDYATIPSWLSNIDNAKLVVTTSFHGIVFCILMHTPFVYIPLKGELSKMNNRAENLLSVVGLESRSAKSESGFEAVALNRDIDWNVVDERIHQLRKDSYEFLRTSILSDKIKQ